MEGAQLSGSLFITKKATTIPNPPTFPDEFKRVLSDDGKNWVIFHRSPRQNNTGMNYAVSVTGLQNPNFVQTFEGGSAYLPSTAYHNAPSFHYDPSNKSLKASGITAPLTLQKDFTLDLIMNPSYLSYTVTKSSTEEKVTVTNASNGYQFQYSFYNASSFVLINKVIFTDRFTIIDFNDHTFQVIRNDFLRKGDLGISTTRFKGRSVMERKMYSNGQIELFVENGLASWPGGVERIVQIEPSGWVSTVLKTITPADINVPGNPQIWRIAPTGNTTTVSSISRGIRINYSLKGDWAGGGFTYDNFSTPPIETQDLTGLKTLIFGMKGDSMTVKFEVVDANDKKWFVTLSGISSTEEKVWSIPVHLITGVDLTRIRALNFIVESGTRSGTLEVYRLRP